MFIVLEGIDGVGKSTQAARLVAWVRRRGHACIGIHEPSGHGAARLPADLAYPPPPVAEIAHYWRDRCQDVSEVIRPAQAAGHWVVLDRYFYSHAYQAAQGADLIELIAANVAAFPIPDLAIFLTLDPVIAAARIRARGGVRTPTDDARFLACVVSQYDRLASRPEVRRVDAGQPSWLVTRDILHLVEGAQP